MKVFIDFNSSQAEGTKDKNEIIDINQLLIILILWVI